MTWTETTQEAVLDAVVARIRSEIDELGNDSTCFVSDYPDPTPSGVVSNLFAIVSPTDGQFGEEEQVGAGAEQVIENTGVVVTVYSTMRLDRPGRIENLLKDDTRGMLPLKQKLLKALASHNLLDANGNTILVNYMHAGRSTAPRFDREKNMGVMSLHFHTDFEWDLS